MEQRSASMGAWCAQFSNLDKLHVERGTIRASLLKLVLVRNHPARTVLLVTNHEVTEVQVTSLEVGIVLSQLRYAILSEPPSSRGTSLCKRSGTA